MQLMEKYKALWKAMGFKGAGGWVGGITALLQIILSNSRLLRNLMSLEIGEITLYSVSFISGCWQSAGIGFLTLGLYSRA